MNLRDSGRAREHLHSPPRPDARGRARPWTRGSASLRTWEMSSSKRSLPSLGTREVPSGPPSIDDARLALGGRVSTAIPRVGALARFRDARGGEVEGVVVCDTTDELDVWIGEGRLQRLPAARVTLVPLGADHALADVGADARVFVSLAEGRRVRFLTRSGSSLEGVLAEKCRYGALVSHEGRVLAVSFRRLWPLDAEGA